MREYDPWLGRWLTKDPILFAGEQANLFMYAFNDPVYLLDPTGLRCSYWERAARNRTETYEGLSGAAGWIANTGLKLVVGPQVAAALGVRTFGWIAKQTGLGAYVWGEAMVAEGAATRSVISTALTGARVLVASGSSLGVGGAAATSAVTSLATAFATEVGIDAGSLIAAALPWGPNGWGQTSACTGECNWLAHGGPRRQPSC